MFSSAGKGRLLLNFTVASSAEQTLQSGPQEHILVTLRVEAVAMERVPPQGVWNGGTLN